MKRKLNLNTLIEIFRYGLERFPEALLASFTTVILTIINVHMDYNAPNRDLLTHVALATFIAIPALLAVKLTVERLDLKLLYRLLMDAVVIVGVVLFAVMMPDDLNRGFGLRYAIVTILLFLYGFSVPFYGRKDNFVSHVYYVFIQFAKVYLYTFVLYLGIGAIITSIDVLFEVEFFDEIYIDTLLIIVGMFGATAFLNGFPKMNQIYDDHYPLVFKILFVYIVIPLISVYTLILHAYFIRILIKGVWPSSIVANLVLWYGIFSIVILFLTERLTAKFKYVEWFKHYFVFAMIVPLGMLFYSIIVRIKQYGFTVPRSLVLYFAIWITINLILIALQKSISAKKIMAITLMTLLVISIGPQSVFNVSFIDQENRTLERLEDFGMIEDGLITGGLGLEDGQKRELSIALRYLADYHNLNRLSFIDQNLTREALEEQLGFAIDYYPSRYNMRDYIFLNSDMDADAIEINGYRYMKAVSYNSYDNSNSMITLKYGDQELNINIDAIGQEAYEASSNETLDYLQTSINGVDVIFVFRHLSGYFAAGEFEVESTEFVVLLK